MSIKHVFAQDACPSFGGASLSAPRFPVIVDMIKYIRSNYGNSITSNDIQDYVRHNKNDTRSIIAVWKKLGFTNLRNGYINASNFFTKRGNIYASLTLVKNEMNSDDAAYNHVERAYQLILQEGILSFLNSEDRTNIGINIILNIIGITKSLSFDEYCFALYRKNFDDYKTIATKIISNRNTGETYEFTKIMNTNDNGTVENIVPTSVLQSAREIMQQAGILAPDKTICELLDSDFMVLNGFAYE